jgi:hypothetical protein
MLAFDPTTIADPSGDEMMTVLIQDDKAGLTQQQAKQYKQSNEKYVYKFVTENEPCCKWFLIYTCGMIVLGGGLITLVYFLWR